MVKDHSDSERGNPLPPHGLLFPISTGPTMKDQSDDPSRQRWCDAETSIESHGSRVEIERERNVLFNDALNTF